MAYICCKSSLQNKPEGEKRKKENVNSPQLSESANQTQHTIQSDLLSDKFYNR